MDASVFEMPNFHQNQLITQLKLHFCSFIKGHNENSCVGADHWSKHRIFNQTEKTVLSKTFDR